MRASPVAALINVASSLRINVNQCCYRGEEEERRRREEEEKRRRGGEGGGEEEEKRRGEWTDLADPHRRHAGAERQHPELSLEGAQSEAMRAI